MSSREHGFRGVSAVEQSAVYALRAPKEFATAQTPEQFGPDIPVDWDDLTLAVEVDVEGKRIRGTATWQGTVRKQQLQRIRFDAEGFEVLRSFGSDGRRLALDHDGRHLWVDLGETVKRGEEVRIAIDFDTREPRAGFYFVLPDADHPDRVAHAWTQGQDEDSKYWFPCHDSPNHKARLQLIATVPEGMSALSNGILRNIYRAADPTKRIFDWQISRPIPIYLLTLVIGPFVEVVQAQEPLPISYWVLPGREEDGERSFGRTPEMVALYEKLTGVPFPFEKYGQVAVAEFVFGGMENASLTTQTDLTLHDARAHLDFSSEPLVSHELAHQWFGDLVTCRTWSHGWLNEGFATYFEQLWQEHAHGEAEFDFARLSALRAYLAEDAGRYRRTIVAVKYDEPIDVFDAHLYEKAGAVLHMLRKKLGDEAFFGAVSSYLQAFADQTAETPDLRRAFEDYTGLDLGKFFWQWLINGKGHPEIKVTGSWDGDERQFSLGFEQTQDIEAAALFSLEIDVELRHEGGVVKRRLTLERKQQSFAIPLPASPTAVLVDPRGDLLATWEFSLAEPLLRATLSGTDVPVWSRLQAAAALAKKPSAQNTAALGAQLASEQPWMLQAEVAKALGKINTLAAWTALTEPQLAHPKARRAQREAMGRFVGEQAGQALAQRLLAGDASVLVEAETARSLGATRASVAFDALVAALDRDSWNETIRVGILDGLAALQDPRGIAVARIYLEKRWPTLLRCGAIRCLCSFSAEPVQAIDALRPWTADTSFRFAFNLASALGQLGDGRAIALLQTVADKAIDGRVKKRAGESIAALRAGMGAGKQVDGLRSDVDALRGQLRELTDQLDRVKQARQIG